MIKARQEATHTLGSSKAMSRVFLQSALQILSAPHGGDLVPPWLAERTEGCLECDFHSWEMAQAVWTAQDQLEEELEREQLPPSAVRLKLADKSWSIRGEGTRSP